MSTEQSPETTGLDVELVATFVRDHIGCNWVSDGVNVRWTCGIIHPGPIHMQPTTRDRHVAALVMTQVKADRVLARRDVFDRLRSALAARVSSRPEVSS